MNSGSDVGSILMADIGSMGTKLSLFDTVNGRYRFVAGGRAVTTTHPSQADVSLGVSRACRQIELVTGRRLMDSSGVLTPEAQDGTGVELFGAAVSSRRALRVLAFGAGDESALRPMLAGVQDACIEVVGCVSLSGVLAKGETVLGRVLEALRRFQPEALLLVDGPGTDSRAVFTELAQALASLWPIDGQAQLPVVYAGEAATAAVLGEVLRGKYEVRFADGLVGEAAAGGQGSAKENLAAVWAADISNHAPGFARVQSWMSMPPIHAPRALAWITRFLSRYYETEVWCVDLGAMATSVFVATQNTFLPTIRESLGVGPGAIGLMAAAETIQGWLTTQSPPSEIRDRLMNRRVRPWVMPQSASDLIFESALARAAVQHALGNNAAEGGAVRPLAIGGLVIGCGAAIAQAPTDGLAALNLLDVLEPAGVVTLVVDRLSVLPQLGALGASFPMAASQVLLTDGLYRLGTCVATEGVIGQSEMAVKMLIERSDGGSVEVEVPSGALHVIPLRANEEAGLKVKPHKKLDVGAGRGEMVSLKVKGGSVGIIVDARGRPINLPSQPKDRLSWFTQWRRSVGG